MSTVVLRDLQPGHRLRLGVGYSTVDRVEAHPCGVGMVRVWLDDGARYLSGDGSTEVLLADA